MTYTERTIDIFLVGTFLGTSSLGLYRMAYNVILLPTSNVAWMLGNVMFPTYAKLQDDLPRLRRAYLKATCAIALLTVPMMLGLLALAQPLVDVLLGDKWSELGRLLTFMSLVGLLQSIGSPRGAVLMATDRPGVMARVGMVAVPTVGFCIYAGLPWDVVGVAIGYTVANFALWIVWEVVTERSIGLRFADFAKALAPVMAAGVAMAAIVYLVRLALFAAGADYAEVKVAVLVLLGMAVYAGIVFGSGMSIAREVREMIAAKFRGRRAA